MSVNYNDIHQIDVPVTDLDDEDDDMIISEANGSHGGADRQVGDMIDDLDYELDGNNERGNTFFKKFVSVFQSKRNVSGSYEMMTSEAGGSDSDTMILDDDDDSGSFDFKDYRIKLLHNHLRRVIMVGTGVFFVLLGIILLLSRGYSTVKLQSHPSNKVVLNNNTHSFYPTTIVVSLDGFHPHYISPHNTPTLHKMMIEDYGAPYMIPSFPSSTFPNHWTLVTGLYPSEHGIVGNSFFDPKLNKQFVNTNPKMGGLDSSFWQGGEPIWQTAFKQGVNSAVHMWPGSEVQGVGIGAGPLFVDKYDGSELLSSKVDRVMGWLDIEKIEKRPELILTYVPTIDSYGHKYGISGSNLTNALKYVDDFVALMQKELKLRHLNDIVNLIFISDHGMAPTSNDRLLYLDDIIDLKNIEHIDGWPLFGLRPVKGISTDDTYNKLKENLEKLDASISQNYRVYKVEDIPKEWQFGGGLDDHRFNYRLAPVWVIPNVGYSITTHKSMKENNGVYSPKGVHGYNNTELLMRAIFLGSGPFFERKLQSGKKIMPFKNTEFYNLLCESLNLIPSANNGSDISSNAILCDNQLLPSDWNDPLAYPDLPFQVDYLVENATYDFLWKKHPAAQRPLTVSVSTNDRPYDSLVSEESSIPILTTETMPKPTDFEENENNDENNESNEGDKNEDDDRPKGHNNGFGNLIDHLEDSLENLEDNLEDAMENAGDTLEDLLGGIIN